MRLEKESKQGLIAESLAPNDPSLLQETTNDIPDWCQRPDRKGGDAAKAILLPLETANLIMGRAHNSFIS